MLRIGEKSNFYPIDIGKDISALTAVRECAGMHQAALIHVLEGLKQAVRARIRSMVIRHCYGIKPGVSQGIQKFRGRIAMIPSIDFMLVDGIRGIGAYRSL